MRILLVLALLLGVQTAHAEESLCVGHEKIVFSCHLGSTILSLCRPLESPRGLTYRCGTLAHVEVGYPSRGPEEQGRFTPRVRRCSAEGRRPWPSPGQTMSTRFQQNRKGRPWRTPGGPHADLRGWTGDLTERKARETSGVRRWRRRLQGGYQLASTHTPLTDQAPTPQERTGHSGHRLIDGRLSSVACRYRQR